MWAVGGAGLALTGVGAVVTAAPIPVFMLGTLATIGGVLYVMPLATGSRWERRVMRRRMVVSRAAGRDVYVPYSDEKWEAAQQLASTDRRAGARALAALRQMPDGADGMGWLDMRPKHPGIAWHAPEGEEAYLSVAFAVTGQIRGIESQASLERAAERFGTFQGSLGATTSLARGVQTLTRVLPPDSAVHEAWVLANLDHDAPTTVLRSYDRLLTMLRNNTMIQRHYVVITWPITDEFRTQAAARGVKQDGWRELMRIEIAAMVRRLRNARMGEVQPLTARQTAAVIRHMQNPSWPIDQAGDVDPTMFGEPGVNRWGTHVVESVDPDGRPVTWLHRTAQVNAGDFETSARTSLWTLPLLSGMSGSVIRTVSFNRVIIPKAEAMSAARTDVVRDRGSQRARAEQGALADDNVAVSLNAAQRRRQDLMPGSMHAGVAWVGYVTVSAQTPQELDAAVRATNDTAATGLGIARLRWQDSYQSAASGTTWPIGRGVKRDRPGLGRSLMSKMESGGGATA